MSAPVILTANGFTSTANNTTVYGSILNGSTIGIAGGATTTTESLAASTVSAPGTLNNWFFSSGGNSRNNSTTFTVRLNNADTALVLTYTSTQTGVKTDTTHNVAVVQGDTVDISTLFGNGTGNFTNCVSALRFTPSTGTTQSFGAFDGTGVTLSGTGPITDFINFVGQLNSSTLVEAEAQFFMPIAGTARYMQMNVVTNGRSTSSTVVTFRKNAGNGNQTFTYTASQTGNKVDTSNTDALVATDLVSCSPVLGTGTGSFIINNVAFWMDSTTDGLSATGSAQPSGRAFTSVATGYVAFGGRLQGNTGESVQAAQLGTAGTFSAFWSYVKTNASTANVTFRPRKNSANVTQVATITALTTGVFKDTTHSDAFVATDTWDIEAAGMATGSVTITAWTMELRTAFTAPQSLAVTTTPVPAIVRATGKVQSTNSTPVPAIARQTGKIQSTNTTPVPAIVRAIGKIVAVTETAVPAIVRVTGKIVAVTETPVPGIPKVTGKSASVTTTPVPALVRSTGKPISITETPVPSIIKQDNERMELTVDTTPIPSITTQFIPGTSALEPPHRGILIAGKLLHRNA